MPIPSPSTQPPGNNRLNTGYIANDYQAFGLSAVESAEDWGVGSPGTFGIPSAPGGGFTLTNGQMALAPLMLAQGAIIKSLSCKVTVVGSAEAVCRMGIYADGGGVPSSLILDAGTVSAASTGVLTISGLNVRASGLIWLAGVSQFTTTSGTFVVLSGQPFVMPYPTSSAALSTSANGVTQTGVTSGLPSTIGTITNGNGNILAVVAGF